MIISIFKLALVALVIMVVWSFLKPSRRGDEPPRKAGRPGAGSVEDLVKCRACDTYVPRVGAKSCGRGNCPQV